MNTIPLLQAAAKNLHYSLLSQWDELLKSLGYRKIHFLLLGVVLWCQLYIVLLIFFLVHLSRYSLHYYLSF